MNITTLNGLHKRRTQLIAQVRETETRIRELIANVEHLDAAISLFDPNHKPVAPQVRYAGHGQVTRMMLTILRKATEPMTIRAITIQLMADLGIATEDRRKIRKMMEQVRTALYRQRG